MDESNEVTRQAYSFMDSDDLVKQAVRLWLDKRWQVRKIETHDFRPLGTDAVVKTTIDVDSDLAMRVSRARRQQETMVPIPVACCPKAPTFQLDATVNGRPVHVIRRSTNERVALGLLEAQLGTAWARNDPISPCVTTALQKLISSDTWFLNSEEASGSCKAGSAPEYFDISALGRRETWNNICDSIRKLLESHEKQARENKDPSQHAAGTSQETPCSDASCCKEQWNYLMDQAGVLPLLAVLHVGYIRTLLIPLKKGQVSVVKVTETAVTKSLKPRGLLQRFLKSLISGLSIRDWVTARLMSIRYPSDVDALKVLAPAEGRFQTSDLEALGVEKNLSPRDDGEWLYEYTSRRQNNELPLADWLTFRSFDLTARRSKLLTPSFVILTLVFVLQILLLIRIRVEGGQVVENSPIKSDIFDNWLAALVSGLPALTLAYAYTGNRQHPSLGFHARYRYLLIGITWVQIICVGLTFLRRDRTFNIPISLLPLGIPDYGVHAIAFSAGATVICLLLFLDGILQAAESYRHKRRFLLVDIRKRAHFCRGMLSIALLGLFINSINWVIRGDKDTLHDALITVYRLVIFPVGLIISGYFYLYTIHLVGFSASRYGCRKRREKDERASQEAPSK